MKIVHLIFSLKTGGAETMLIDIVNEQSKNHDVNLIIINKKIDNNLLKTIEPVVKIIYIERRPGSRSIKPILKLNLVLFKIRPKIIHCHQPTLINLISLKNKAVLTVHDVNIPTNNFNKFKKIFAISESVKRDIEKRSKQKAIVIYNGIKVEEVSKKVDFSFSIFKIVQVSRLNHEKKGQHLLLKALHILVNERKINNVRLDIIGMGTSLNYLQQLVIEYNIQEFVNFLGKKDRLYIYRNLKNYDLLVQPSLYEGFGLTIAEGMAANLPVLVSDIDGPMEVISEGKYGTTFNSGDIKDLSNKIENIIFHYSKAEQKSQLASEIVNQKFSLANNSNTYLHEYI